MLVCHVPIYTLTKTRHNPSNLNDGVPITYVAVMWCNLQQPLQHRCTTVQKHVSSLLAIQAGTNIGPVCAVGLRLTSRPSRCTGHIGLTNSPALFRVLSCSSLLWLLLLQSYIAALHCSYAMANGVSNSTSFLTPAMRTSCS